MILHAYTMYDKKIKVYGGIQVVKELPGDLETAYQRQAIKDLDGVKKFKDNVLYYIGEFNDLTGHLEQLDHVVVVDFDSLILDSITEATHE